MSTFPYYEMNKRLRNRRKIRTGKKVSKRTILEMKNG